MLYKFNFSILKKNKKKDRRTSFYSPRLYFNMVYFNQMLVVAVFALVDRGLKIKQKRKQIHSDPY